MSFSRSAMLTDTTTFLQMKRDILALNSPNREMFSVDGPFRPGEVRRFAVLGQEHCIGSLTWTIDHGTFDIGHWTLDVGYGISEFQPVRYPGSTDKYPTSWYQRLVSASGNNVCYLTSSTPPDVGVQRPISNDSCLAPTSVGIDAILSAQGCRWDIVGLVF